MKRKRKTATKNVPARARSTPATCSAPCRFYWKQSYELGDNVHWALHDTHTDAEAPPERISCTTMILEAHDPLHFGKPLDQCFLPKLIVELLNAHYAKAQNDGDQ